MKKPFRFFKWSGKKAVVLFVLTLSLVFVAVDVTLAYLLVKTDSLDSIFTPPVLHVSLEGIDDITNTGDVPVYVRALGVANWVSEDDEHTVLSEVPRGGGVDFQVNAVSEGWFEASDGFYYYENPLAPGESVPLFESVIQTGTRVGYELRMEIISSGIQAYPEEAIAEAWPAVQIVDGKLAPVATR